MLEVTYLQSIRASFFDGILLFGVVALAFGDLPYLYDYLGGFSMQGGAYFFVPAALIFFFMSIWRARLSFPNSFLTLCFFFFILQLITSIVLNLEGIIEHSLYGRSGVNQLLRQGATLFIGIVTMYFVFERCRRNSGQVLIERGIIISVIFVIPVALLQFLASLQFPIAQAASAAIGYLFRYTELVEGAIRVTGFKSEPSLFSVWVAFVFPFLAVSWMVNFKYSNFRKLASFLILLIVFMSSSRTGIGIVIAQIVVILGCMICYGQASLRARGKKLALLILTFFIGIPVLFSYISEGANLPFNFNAIKTFQSLLVIDGSDDIDGVANYHWQSNAIRLGAQMANISLGFDNPFFGVGFSQSPFFIDNYMPYWAGLWSEGRDPFTGIGLHSRVFSELGIAGTVFWVAFWISAFYKLITQCKSKASIPPKKILATILLAVGLGLFLCGFAHDSFSYFEYWVYFGMVFAAIDPKNNISKGSGVTKSTSSIPSKSTKL